MSTVEGGRRRAPVVLDGIVSYLDAGLQTSNYNLSNNICHSLIFHLSVEILRATNSSNSLPSPINTWPSFG